MRQRTPTDREGVVPRRVQGEDGSHADHFSHKIICDTGAQNPSFVVFGLLIESCSTLHLIKNIFTVSKYLVSKGSYTHLIRRIRKVKKRIKSLTFFVSS